MTPAPLMDRLLLLLAAVPAWAWPHGARAAEQAVQGSAPPVLPQGLRCAPPAETPEGWPGWRLAAEPVPGAAPAPSALLLTTTGGDQVGLALALAPALLQAGCDCWALPRADTGVTVEDLPRALLISRCCRPLWPGELGGVWSQINRCSLLSWPQGCGAPEWWLSHWRRHPWQRRWQGYGRPMELGRFQRRFLPSRGLARQQKAAPKEAALLRTGSDAAVPVCEPDGAGPGGLIRWS